MKILFYYLLGINAVAFLVFGWDKWMAKMEKRRVPERTLFWLAALGGSVGALAGMKVWHHKTLHKSFRFGIPAILAVQILLVLGLWIWRTF